MAKTETGKKVSKSIQKQLDQQQEAYKFAISQGYPERSDFTDIAYEQLRKLAKSGDKEAKEALARSGRLFNQYKKAGDYKKTNFADIEKKYLGAGKYDAANLAKERALYEKAGRYQEADLESLKNQYRKATDYDALNIGKIIKGYDATRGYEDLDLSRLRGDYRTAGKYDERDYESAMRRYDEEGEYDAASFDRSDYTTGNIKERMSPYEKLVADQQRKRLKKSYDEARGEREMQAVRAGAFGGSGAAIQEEVARRNLTEQMAQMDAQSLQSAYEAAVGLYGKEMADNMAAQAAEEQSRQYGSQAGLAAAQGILAAQQAAEASSQFGKEAEFKGLAGIMAAKQAEEQSRQFGTQSELESLQGMMSAEQAEEASRQYGANLGLQGLEAIRAAEAQEEASRQFGKEAEFKGIAGIMDARQLEEASRQFGKGAEFQGLGGALSARQQTAAQVAAAKEAELESLRGMGASAAQQAALAQQAYNKQASTISAFQQAGQQEEARNLAHNMYPMSVSQAQAGATGALFGGVQQVPTQGQPKTDWFQTAASLASAGAGILNAASDWGFRRGGLVPSGLQRHRVVRRYNGGGLADLQPQYYSKYER